MAETPKLIMVRGLPGSGKSFLAAKLQEQLKDGVVLLDPDSIDMKGEDYMSFSAKLSAEGVDEKLHPYRFLRSRAYDGITAHKIIIWNQAFTQQEMLDKTIKNLQAYAEEHDEKLPAMVVEVSIDIPTAKQRVAGRHQAGGHNVTDKTFERFINDYATFASYGYPIVEIDGNGNIDNSVARVLEAASKL